MKNASLTILLAVLMALSLVTGCAPLPENVGRKETHAYPDTGDTRLGREISRQEAAHPPGESGFHLLSHGLDAFVARAALAQVAERSIDVQYYLYHDDLVGRLFTWHLLQAADRGVRVRLLVDDMDLAGRDLGATVLNSHPNVEVRIFNPFTRHRGRMLQYLTRMGSVTRRMHSKSYTVDSQATILGGRNIGNEYFDADPDLEFMDLDVLSVGPVARDVSTAFDRYWNSELAYPVSVLVGKPPTPEEIAQKRRQLEEFVAAQADSVYLKALRDSDLADKIRKHQVGYSWGNGVVLYDRPEKLAHDKGEKEYQLFPQLKPYAAGVQKELIIFSPYFVPGEAGTAFLAGLAARGVQVRIFTNSLASNDVTVVHAGYAKYRKALLRGGVELYEMNRKLTPEERKGRLGSSTGSLHAKSWVYDRQQVHIGSMNLDPRSVVFNTEIVVVLTSPEIAQRMGDWFDRNAGKAGFRLELKKDANGSETLLWHGVVDDRPQTFDVDPYTGFWKRLGIWFLGILPIESQL